MESFSKLLKILFYVSFVILGIGFGCHLVQIGCAKIAHWGAFLLIFSPALGFLYLTIYYFFSAKNKKLALLSLFVFLILFFNIIFQK